MSCYNCWQERKYAKFQISQGKLETAEPPNQVTVTVCPRGKTARPVGEEAEFSQEAGPVRRAGGVRPALPTSCLCSGALVRPDTWSLIRSRGNHKFNIVSLPLSHGKCKLIESLLSLLALKQAVPSDRPPNAP